MILDVLSRACLYEPLHPVFAAAFAFLRRPDLATLPEGRLALDGERLFAIVQEYETKPLAGGLLEVHRRYIDIQVVVSGEELVGYAPLAGQTVKEPYQEARDIAFLEGRSDLLPLRAGSFAIFYPHDAHMPSRAAGTPARVRKIVIKVAVA